MGIHRPTADDPLPIAAANHRRHNITGISPPSDDHHRKPKINGRKSTQRNKKNRNLDNPTSAISSSSSSIVYSNKNNNSNSSSQRGIRIPNKRRFSLRRNCSDVEAIAFPLGMSIAAVFAQVLERKDLTTDSMSADYLSMICTSAVRESLTNVFGEKFDAFAVNFEKSFGSTLNTIRLIRNSEIDNGKYQVVNHKVNNCNPGKIFAMYSIRGECFRKGDIAEGCTASVFHDDGASQYMKANEDLEDHATTEYGNQEISPQGLVSWQLAHPNQRHLFNHSVLSTIEKSVSEQTRANELKSLEIDLIMKKMQLKETQLALNSDSNSLERCKLSLGISKASFKVEKFKTQLEETEHGELLKRCADYLVTGLIIMSCCLCCGVYAFSYDNLRQLTKLCYPPEGSQSWWWPMASFNLKWQTLVCQFQVYCRMIFGGLMIGVIVLALLQRSDIARQSMPITFIVLLLGFLCGFVGKFCVDTLGGDSYTWLILWEIFCIVHFLAIVFNPSLYYILYANVQMSQGIKYRSLFPFWIRRWLFNFFLIVLPVCCGLLPFASASIWWEDCISVVIRNHWLATFSEPYDAGSHE